MGMVGDGVVGAVEVRAVKGKVRGRWERGVGVFRGIPFAQAPVGELHLAAPVEVEAWEGVRDAGVFGASPPQSLAVGDFGGGEGGAQGDEWLTVNVWSPDPGAGVGMPVMVWLYGGGYVIGTSDGPTYDGTALAGHGVVVVTFNHRVGVEGYGHFEGAPANRALLDQVAALRWVRENIAAFGGDPDQVTLFGESAGAGAIASLLAMPSAAGLFRRAVAQSVPGSFFTPALASDIGSVIADGLGLSPTLADLGPVTPAALRDAADVVMRKIGQYEPRWGQAARGNLPFSPVVDGEVLPCTPWEALRAGRSAGIELMAGHTRDEARLFSVVTGRFGKVTEEEAAATLAWFAPGEAGRRAYRAGYPGADPTTMQDVVLSDWLFRMPSIRLAQAHAEGGGTSYAFELTWEAPGSGGVLGACHGLDVPLVFGSLRGGVGALIFGEEPSAEAEALSAEMVAAWAAFAKTGDPGWAPYRPQERLTRVYSARPHTAPYPEELSRRIWAEHEFAALDLVKSG